MEIRDLLAEPARRSCTRESPPSAAMLYGDGVTGERGARTAPGSCERRDHPARARLEAVRAEARRRRRHGRRPARPLLRVARPERLRQDDADPHDARASRSRPRAHPPARLRGAEATSASALSRVGGIVEEPRFYPYLSGRRNLDVWAAHYGGEARARIPAVLDRVALTERADDKVKTYSLGMRQRLGVARALLNDPELLVLDEPTNGLDPAGMLEFRTMIRDLVEKEGRTVFISSHILDEVQKMADDIAIVQAGRLISWGPVDELIAAGRHSVLLRTDDEARARSVLSGISFVTGVGTQRGLQRARPRGRRHQRRAADRDQPDARRGRRRRGRDLAREREPRAALPRSHGRQQAGRHEPRARGTTMLAAEIRRIVGRRGSFWSAIFVGFATVVIDDHRPADAERRRRRHRAARRHRPDLDRRATLMAVLVGALAGSYDTAQGTMRYLVMTGVPRRRLYATRVARHGDRDDPLLPAGRRPDDRRGLRPAPQRLQRPDAERRSRRRLGLRRESARVRARERGRRLAAALQRRGDRRLARLRRSAAAILTGAGRQLRQRDARVLPPARRHRHRGATRPPRRTSRWPPRSRPSSCGSSRSSAPGSGACCATSTDGVPRGRAPGARPRARTLASRSPAAPPDGGVAVAGRSVGGSIVMFGRTLSSQRGMYQDFSPSSVSSAGTTVSRMISASVRIATASSRPNSLLTRSGVSMNGDEHRRHDDRRGEHDAADRRRRRPGQRPS